MALSTANAVNPGLVGSIRPQSTVRLEAEARSRPGALLRDLWDYRELVFFLTWREVMVRYKQTGLGVAWAVLQPLLTMAVFSIFFGKLGKMPSDGVPYPIFAFTGLLPWMFFANGMGLAANSLVSSANLITKIYFPRIAIPLSAVLPGLVDFSCGFGLFLLLAAYFGVTPSWHILALPFFLALTVMTALGVGLWLSALNVKYRDVRYTVPFLTQFWMFATPVAYPSSLLPEKWAPLFALNPMVGVVEGFRWSVLGSDVRLFPVLAVSIASSALILLTGFLFFQRVEREFADIV